MYDYMEAAVKALEEQNYTLFGEMVGHASKDLLDGRRQLKKDASLQHPTKPKDQVQDDPKALFAMKMGAEFAAGFIYGAGVGGFDEREIFECLKKEQFAD